MSSCLPITSSTMNHPSSSAPARAATRAARAAHRTPDAASMAAAWSRVKVTGAGTKWVASAKIAACACSTLKYCAA
jgi:hypothetical protein